MKVAIVHDWLTTYTGAEKVVEQILEIYPDADLFTLVDFLKENDRTFLNGVKVTTSFIQKMPFAKKKYRNYLPLMPIAIEQFDLSSYDLIISSSHAVAKGVITGPDQFHISYIHTPIRYAWDLQHQYLRESGLNRGLKSHITRAILHYIRLWDYRTSAGVDLMVSNSNFIRKRIQKVYNKNAITIYPPVDVSMFQYQEIKQDYYLTASRLVPYKKVDLIVEAFSKMPDKTLYVIGDGPDMEKVKSFQSSNVKLLGYQSTEDLRKYMQNAKAFVFAAEEDFGITPVEAQACGTPVIAFGKGGALETVIGNPEIEKELTGLFFYEQTTESLIDAVERFESIMNGILPQNCREHALKFSNERFREEFNQLVQSYLFNSSTESNLNEIQTEYREELMVERPEKRGVI
ncbi:glycosyl transferase [Paenibacillus sp. J45TS6]|uniref:glycosyltransferase family 4 protein n=1 Tax=Paenibacillus sp. J45TS6 TaxID=2807196 RepID=UPI001B0EE8E7|nr:glycosyltransferase family 4 protein [Paenibacillus sp. J45TS6]GIP44132.1 glycosyl transferase [Paenibacillus sp. J45TS6]